MTLLPSRAICGSVTERICQKVSEFNPGLAANSAAELKRSKRSVRMAVQYTPITRQPIFAFLAFRVPNNLKSKGDGPSLSDENRRGTHNRPQTCAPGRGRLQTGMDVRSASDISKNALRSPTDSERRTRPSQAASGRGF